MYNLLVNILEEAPKDMENGARTSAKDSLFTIDYSFPLLNKKAD